MHPIIVGSDDVQLQSNVGASWINELLRVKRNSMHVTVVKPDFEFFPEEGLDYTPIEDVQMDLMAAGAACQNVHASDEQESKQLEIPFGPVVVLWVPWGGPITTARLTAGHENDPDL